MQVHCLHWLMSTGQLFQSAVCWPCKSMIGEMAPKEGSNLAVGTWYGSHCQCVSVKSLYWNAGPLWIHLQIIYSCPILYYFCPPASLFKLFPPPTPPLHAFSPISMNFMKKSSKMVIISHYLPAKLVVQNLIDN